MSELKVDTDNFKKDYQFLDKIWTLYDEFNKTIDNTDHHESNYVNMCKQIMQNVDDKQEWYINLCIKLIRNLGAFSTEKNKAKYNSEHCKNLKSWLYYLIKDYNVDQDVITNIFNQSNTIMASGVNEPYCSNYLYKDIYNNPDKIIKLINLEEYLNEFSGILKNKNANNHCLCLKFIFECAKIYRDMNKTYCTGPTRDNSIISNTCTKLQGFYSFFTLYICTIKELNGNLPSLDAAENERILTCPSDKREQELEPGQKSELDSSGIGQSSSPKKISISTAIGTMAGIPPFLAQIYKFTPVGT